MNISRSLSPRAEQTKQIISLKLLYDLMSEILVLDTSVLISGAILPEIESGKLSDVEVCIPQAALDELQAQASKNVDVGFIGLDHLKSLREMCERKGIQFYFRGPTPTLEDIKLAKSGGKDAIIETLQGKSKGLYAQQTM